MARLRTSVAAFGAAVLAATSLGVLTGSPAQAQPFNYGHLNKIQQRLVSGLLAAELNGADPAARAQGASPPAAPRAAPTSSACTNRFGDNVKVNQNCLNLTDPDLQGRAQAQNETWIAVDPNNADHLVGSYNDYRRGDGTCGVSYSLDGGKSWADATTPNGFTRGTAFGGAPREYWQASGDTSVAWDQGQRVPVVPAVQPWLGDLAESGPVKLLLRLPVHRYQRGVLELPGTCRGRAQRRGRRR